jgi:ATP-dependent helicase HrpB
LIEHANRTLGRPSLGSLETRTSAANIAAIMSERDLGGRSSDVDDRLAKFRSDNGPRAKAMRDLARRWSREAGANQSQPEISSGVVLARAFPERIAKARDGTPGRFILAGGRGALLDETDPLARSPWIVAADVTGSGPDLRILLAARITQDEVMALGNVETIESARYDPASQSIRARRVVRLGAITLADIPMPSPPAALIRAVSATRAPVWTSSWGRSGRLPSGSGSATPAAVVPRLRRGRAGRTRCWRAG